MSYRSLYWVAGGLLVALILAWILPELKWQVPSPIRPDIPQISDRPAGDNDAVMPSGDAVARPPFWASRRPVAEEAPVAEGEEENDIDGAIIVGLLRRDGNPVVIIRQVDGKSRRIVAGQELSGWKLTTIQDDIAVFQRADGETRSLRIVRRRVEDLPQRSMQQDAPQPPQQGQRAQNPPQRPMPPQHARPTQRMPGKQ